MAENKVAGKKGGGIARKARRELEDQTGKSVVTGESFLPPGARKSWWGSEGADLGLRLVPLYLARYFDKIQQPHYLMKNK